MSEVQTNMGAGEAEALFHPGDIAEIDAAFGVVEAESGAIDSLPFDSPSVVAGLDAVRSEVGNSAKSQASGESPLASEVLESMGPSTNNTCDYSGWKGC